MVVAAIMDEGGGRGGGRGGNILTSIHKSARIK